MSNQSCILFDKLLSDDLYPYDIQNNTIIWYDAQATQTIGTSPILLDTAKLYNLLNISADSEPDLWRPVIISDYADYKAVSNYGEVTFNDRLGIDLFLRIMNPEFQTFNTNATIATDWILNNQNLPYRPSHGVLCWVARRKPQTAGSGETIDNFPINDRLSISPNSNDCNKVYIKLSNEKVMLEHSSEIIGVDDLSTSNEPQLFWPSLCYSTISKLGNKLQHNYLSDYKLWIADGDCFLNYDSSQGLPPPTFDNPAINTSNYIGYVSGSLYNSYINIYRILTLDVKREINFKNLRIARKYKNIAKILSTSPFVTQTDIYNLDDPEIKKIVDSIDGQTPGNTTISLNNAAIQIVDILQKKSGRKENLGYNQSNNFILTTTQLCDKILKKYGSNLIAENNTFLSVNTNNLKIDNYGINIRQAAEVYSKNPNPTAIQRIAYDNNLVIEPRFLDSRSYLSINYGGSELSYGDTEGIPLFNVAKPPFTSYYGDHFLSPALMYKGDVSAVYRNDFNRFNEETTGYRTDAIYFAELNIFNPSDLNSDPLAPQSSSLISIELQVLHTDFLDANLYTDAPFFDPDVFLESQCQFSWKKISGPEGYFSRPDDPRSSSDGDEGILPIRGVTNNVLFKTYFSGKYLLECEVKCPVGSFKLRKTLYVVDGRQRFPAGAGNNVQNSIYGKYWEPALKQWLIPVLGPDTKSDIGPLPGVANNGSIFLCSNVAIDHKSGVYFPIQTNAFVMEQIGVLNNLPDDKAYGLSSNYVFSYRTENAPKYTYNENGSLLINYICNENTYVKVNKLILSKIRSKLPGCENCVSLYQPNLRSRSKTFVVPGGRPIDPATTVDGISTERINKYPSAFILIDYRTTDQDSVQAQDRIVIDYPKISTTNSPNIKSYGGYSRDIIIGDMGINTNIQGLPMPRTLPDPNNTLASATSPILPTISGHKLNYRNEKDTSSYKICYQKIKDINPRSIVFDKGVFEPASGWIGFDKQNYLPQANKSAVLKFNPGARDTFTFIGPMLREMDKPETANSDTTIVPTEYSSSIILGISDHIQWEPMCGCGTETVAEDQNYRENMLHKEYVDIKYDAGRFSESNHGYRILAGGEPKDIEKTARDSSSVTNDEFDTQQTDNAFSYKFAVTGPYDLIKNERIPRVNGFSIQDIEIKLNFLNYVNMKDVIVLLEVKHDPQEIRRRFEEQNKQSPIFVPFKYFINQKLNSNIVGDGDIDYLIDELNLPKNYRELYFTESRWVQLFNTQSNMSGSDNVILDNTSGISLKTYINGLMKTNSLLNQEKLQLVLWNQEHLQNNKANISLTFSDHAPLNNVPYDKNVYNNINAGALPVSYFMNEYQQKQHIILDNDNILPSCASMNYSDRDACFYGNIIKNNRLWIPNNSLTKFISDSLFRSPPPRFGPCPGGAPKQTDSDYSGTTTFTLKFIVMDEPDTMNPYDNTLLSQYQWGLETSETLVKSTQIFNSLCNWELILHTQNTRKRPPYTTHNLSSYGNGDPLSLLDYNNGLAYPGYSYIADLSSYRHMLPLMNHNAPYNIIQDATTCLSGIDDPTGQGIMVRPPEFPIWAIVAILSSIYAYGGLTGGTLVGAVSALPLAVNNLAYQILYDWFSATAITASLADQGRQIFAPLYHKYPFGSPEKILLNFRKPGGLWYTAEAFISKYHNTPILKNTNYNFIKVNDKNNQFNFEIVSSYEELIDKKFILEPDICTGDGIEKNKELEIIRQPEYNGHIIDLSANCPNEEYKNKYYIPNNNRLHKLYKKTGIENDTYYDSENFSAMKYAYHYMVMNSVVNLSDDANTLSIFENYAELIKKQRIIKIKGRLLYDVLRSNDTLIFPYTDEEGREGTVSIQINNISLVYFDNSYHTIITLKTVPYVQIPANSSTFYIDRNANILFVFKPASTYYDNNNIKKHNKWGFVDHAYKHNYYTAIENNIRARGSYGDGSPFVEKLLLSNNQTNNDIKNISESLNNRQNNRIKTDKINIFNNNNQIVNSGYIGGYSGFGYSLDEISNTQEILLNEQKETKTIIPSTGNTILPTQLNLSIALSDEYNTELFFIRQEENFDLNIASGSLELITDQTEIIPEKDLTEQQVNIISNRYNRITNTKENKQLVALIGISQSTQGVLNSDNIYYIEQHLEALENRDPNKQLTQDALNRLVAEKGNLVDIINKKIIKEISVTILENNRQATIRGEVLAEDANSYIVKIGTERRVIDKNSIETSPNGDQLISFTYKPKILNPNENILSKYQYEIIVNRDRSLKINYIKANADYYWINLDPKQSCVADFAMNPKILTETEYACVPSSRLAMRNANLSNNACPEFLTVGDKQPSNSAPNVEEDFSTRAVTDPDNPSALVTAYVYKIKKAIIARKQAEAMSRFNGILGWKTIYKTRYFNINGDEIIGLLTDVNGDITIQSKETYIIPQTIQDLPEQGAGTDGSADNTLVSGLEGCQGVRPAEGSPGGKGLLGLQGEEPRRVGGPTRIQNIVNLDNQNNIEISFKNIPRGLRPSDSLATIYRYGPKDVYRQSNSASPKVPYEVDLINLNGAINNSLYEWIAMQVDPSSKTLEYTNLPDFFVHQNEMSFRGLYGSVDNVEHKTEIVKSQYPFEMIPFEYSDGIQ